MERDGVPPRHQQQQQRQHAELEDEHAHHDRHHEHAQLGETALKVVDAGDGFSDEAPHAYGTGPKGG